MVFMKAEIERLKVEMMRYQVQNDKDKTELDKKQLDMEKSMLNNSQVSKKDYGVDENAVRKVKEERMLWESQKMELTYKIKSLQRRIGEDGDRYKELERELEFARSEVQKLELQIDEMRSIYRNKLIQFTRNETKNRDIEAREELVRTYNEKEVENKERMDSFKKESAQQKLEIKALRSYGRKLRYIAEDWAPLGQ